MTYTSHKEWLYMCQNVFMQSKPQANRNQVEQPSVDYGDKRNLCIKKIYTGSNWMVSSSFRFHNLLTRKKFSCIISDYALSQLRLNFYVY